MNEKFLKYLKEIGITTQKLTNRIDELYQISVRIAGHEFEDILIEDVVKKNMERDYVNVGFFTKDTLFSFGNIYEDKIDIIPFSKFSQKLTVITIRTESYDFIEANEESRLLIEVGTPTVSLQSRATSKNCDYLKNIYEKYYKPLLKN